MRFGMKVVRGHGSNGSGEIDLKRPIIRHLRWPRPVAKEKRRKGCESCPIGRWARVEMGREALWLSSWVEVIKLKKQSIFLSDGFVCAALTIFSTLVVLADIWDRQPSIHSS
ncbi:uncharacterized protein LY79DRAFT_155357 [Colletotrichum navitas]|uniref:Uncharacterized protein n=1 Tax=Colletotrichum navitas TaxID=681940 RepID=A0AAD8Q3K2_9PEZI|nr:uncharacterized protein LY79DRAFT_155357 [Colletotrichum navitas]KAK1594387.1 hypothetical protein LY79DRAFT_155357 [Colletotrichum navitas]